MVSQLDRKVLVTATSATAALRLGFDKSDTVDAACQFRVGKSLGALQPDHPKTMALQDADLLVCEEFSLMDQLRAVPPHQQDVAGYARGRAAQGAPAGQCWPAWPRSAEC